LTAVLRTPETPAPPDPRATATLEILERLLAGLQPREFAIRLWDGTAVPAEPGRPTRFTIVLNRPDALYRMFVPPGTRSLGEAYASGDFDVAGDMIAFFDLLPTLLRNTKPLAVVRLLPALLRLRTGGAGEAGREAGRRLPAGAALSGRIHNRDRDRVAVRHHYDMSNAFFALWLDERMVYSCSYFPTGQETLDESQERKLELICRKLRLQPGERFLDLGCGYGGLLMYAVERFGVQGLGITLSEQHGLLARERIRAKGLGERCRVEIMDYRDLDLAQPFDKIAAIGITEHVGERRLPDFFRRVQALLKPGGLFLNHCICWRGDSRRWRRALEQFRFIRQNFILRYVFPDLDLVPPDVIVRAAGRAGLEVRDLENLRPHYAITLRHWFERLNAKWDRAVAEVGEPTARVYRAYLAYCSYAFAANKNSLIHTLLGRPDSRGGVDIPLSRADLYR
jgi:cyclopropane-fatty-acyl-phospholipid synthase